MLLTGRRPRVCVLQTLVEAGESLCVIQILGIIISFTLVGSVLCRLCIKNNSKQPEGNLMVPLLY